MKSEYEDIQSTAEGLDAGCAWHGLGIAFSFPLCLIVRAHKEPGSDYCGASLESKFR